MDHHLARYGKGCKRLGVNGGGGKLEFHKIASVPDATNPAISSRYTFKEDTSSPSAPPTRRQPVIAFSFVLRTPFSLLSFFHPRTKRDSLNGQFLDDAPFREIISSPSSSFYWYLASRSQTVWLRALDFRSDEHLFVGSDRWFSIVRAGRFVLFLCFFFFFLKKDGDFAGWKRSKWKE